MQAALFPCGISMASTWNLEMIEEIGRHLGEEAKARGANVLLAPTVCMHRSPLGGRNFESYSENLSLPENWQHHTFMVFRVKVLLPPLSTSLEMSKKPSDK